MNTAIMTQQVRILRIPARLIVLAVAFVAAAASAIADNTPVGTTFTYQGRLTEAGQPVDDQVDFVFRLYAVFDGGTPLPGGVLVADDYEIGDDGRFTIDLNFGDQFTGEPRWLEIEVNGATLSPRQPIMAVPHAMVATTAANVPTKAVVGSYAGITGVGTLESLNVSGNVGIGTATPQSALHMLGSQPTVRLEHAAGDSYSEIMDGTAQQLRINKVNNAGGVLLDLNPKATNGTSNAQVRFFRETNTTGPKYVQFLRGDFSTSESARIGVDGENSFFQAHGGNLGVGTSSPEANLHINGAGSSAVGFRIDQPGSSTGYISMGSPLGHTAIAAAANNGNRRDIRFTDSGLAFSVGSSSSSPPTNSGMFITESGNVGIGTTSPAAKLHLSHSGNFGMRVQNGADRLDIGFNSINTEGDGFFGDPLYLNNDVSQHVLIGMGGGNTGIGGATAGFPLVKLHVDGGTDATIPDLTSGYLLVGDGTGANIVMDNNEIMARNNGATSILHLNADGGEVRIGSNNSSALLSTPVLQITGGSDLSERFDVAELDELSPEPGMVVCIDPTNPGKLIPSSRAYDRTVAGVISGANGVKTGMIMGQEHSEADGEHAVALTGRVYVMVDASTPGSGAIEPGDLLTTSDVPGHAMKVGDHAAAQGAIIGKAMTALKEGETGLVLVLVTLQ